MNSSLRITPHIFAAGLLLLSLTVLPENLSAADSGVRFQRPGGSQSGQTNANFRRPGIQSQPAQVTEKPRAEVVETDAPARVVKVAKPATIKRAPAQRAPAPKPVRTQQVVQQRPAVQREQRAERGSVYRAQYDTDLSAGLQLASYGCDICGGDGNCDCACEVGCGCPEPSCGLYEPGCGISEPSCGCGEPSCGICEPGCGLAEPSCGCGEVGCGSCVGLPGADYFCFPICLPKFKDLSAWAGVQGFRGPRDFTNGRSDSNFGFNEGINVSGRAPLIGLLMPQLSYQLGYRAVQSRLHGTVDTADDRSQQFVTAGFFRRVNTGIQGGVVWDLLRDDLDRETDVHQIRYELSLKSPQGREIGIFGTSSTNTVTALGTSYEAVDQYALFMRWAFGNGYESRLWGGGTGNSEGLFGGEFFAPLNDRWTVQTGFNYLITDLPDGPAGVSQESWNIGINLVWHLGSTAKRGCRSPFRPLFSVADNGWMFVDQVP